jgi:hypothetical protein
VRYHLRAPEPWVLTVAFGCALGMMLSLRDWNWLGDPLWGQETIGIGQVLVLPLAGGGAAVMGWRDRGAYFSFLPKGPQARHLARAIGAWWLPLAATYVLANAFCVVASGGVEVSVADATVFPLLTQVLGLLVALTVGYAIGYAVNSWAAALVAGVLLAVTLTLDRLGTVTTGLAEYAANGPMLGAQANLAYFAARGGWMLVLAGSALALVVLTPRLQRLVWGIVLVALVGGTVLFGTNDSYVYVKSASDYCTGVSIQVCGPRALAPRVREAAFVAAPVGAALSALGVEPPERLTSWDPASKDTEWVMLLSGDRFRDPLDPGQVISAVASPTSCRLWTAEEIPPASWFAADRLVRSYLAHAVGRKGGLDFQQLSGRVGAAKATGVVRRAARALQACDVSLVPGELRG